MEWYKVPLTFRANGPIHIGAGTLGFINLTRPYIPAKNLWGALTRGMATRSGKELSFELFKACGDFINRNIRFSYFYPALQVNGEWQSYAPSFNQDGLHYGEMNAQQFQNRFIGSYLSTALDGETSGAAEGMLHEVEFILDEVREFKTGTLQPFYYRGKVYFRSGDGECIREEGIDLGYSQLLENLSSLLVGGDLCYGLGEIVLEPGLVGEKESCGSEDDPIIEYQDQELVLRAHTRYRHGLVFRGDVEPVVSRNWDPDKGPGRQLYYEGTFFTPGTVIEQKGLRAKILAYGFWELEEEEKKTG